VEPVRLPNGSTNFIIDRLRSVTLPPMPAALLSVLLADTGPSNDEFVAWKSRAKVRQRLRQMTGKQFSPGTLNQLVYRLRELLPEQAVHPDFIRRDTRRGLRFALRREPPGSAPPGSAPGI
jgi:DNA-binding winged helix-turn-helix (wHTH) protein